jgi:hypothetical protein
MPATGVFSRSKTFLPIQATFTAMNASKNIKIPPAMGNM